MFIHVIDSKYLSGHRVWVSFNDGTAGEIDLLMDLDGEIFDPLKNPNYFKTFRIEGHTLAWENGADFAPEFLHDKIAQQRAPGDAKQQRP
jgi:hypothetical protein